MTKELDELKNKEEELRDKLEDLETNEDEEQENEEEQEDKEENEKEDKKEDDKEEDKEDDKEEETEEDDILVRIKELEEKIEQQQKELELANAKTLKQKKEIQLTQSLGDSKKEYRDLIDLDSIDDENYEEEINNKIEAIDSIIESKVNYLLEQEKNKLLKGQDYKEKEGKKDANVLTKEEYDNMSITEKVKAYNKYPDVVKEFLK